MCEKLKQSELDRKVGLDFTNPLRCRIKFILNLSTHKSSTSEGAAHEEEPDRSPSKSVLKGANGKKANGGSDGSASVDESSNSSKGLVVSADRWVGGKISSNSRSDNIVGSAQKENEKRMLVSNKSNMIIWQIKTIKLTLQQEYP